jgi:hypothetical protein
MRCGRARTLRAAPLVLTALAPWQAWTLLGFFVTTVAGLVLEPVPAGAWVSSRGKVLKTFALSRFVDRGQHGCVR